MNNFTNFFSDLDKGESKIWDLLAQGVVNKKSKFHTPTLSTINGHAINSRTIILRKVDNKTKMLFFYSEKKEGILIVYQLLKLFCSKSIFQSSLL